MRRGLQVYQENCSACHSLNYITYQDLSALNYNQDEPNKRLPTPFLNQDVAKEANNGIIPPDLSLIARARAIPRPFPALISDIFTNYTTEGADYIASLLTGYNQIPPAGLKLPENTWYNPYYSNGPAFAMPPPLNDGDITYNDGTSETVQNYARDVAAFLMWTADPYLEKRKKTGFRVLLFLIVLSLLAYLIKRDIWKNNLHNDIH
ncbi:cytochrome c1 [Bartonella sp. DGB2]|uniref:cytochrome c1 n=1 Tax=Bartonella sp. DGB2 TaxID=3388426 RepID=UPI00398FD06F